MNKDCYFENLIVIKSKEPTIKTVRCRECKNPFFLPPIPFCQNCQTEMDNCQHGIAWVDCSWRIIWQKIVLGNLKVNPLSSIQIKEIQRNIQERFQLEVYVDEENYFRVKSRP